MTTPNPKWRVATNGEVFRLEYQSHFDQRWTGTTSIYHSKQEAERDCQDLNAATPGEVMPVLAGGEWKPL